MFAAGPRSPAQTAFEVACSWARAGSADEALRWVEAAVDAGFRAPGVLDGEPDLAVGAGAAGLAGRPRPRSPPDAWDPGGPAGCRTAARPGSDEIRGVRVVDRCGGR